jgi:uncharacterized glyoxalase superfamily protein PhnB
MAERHRPETLRLRTLTPALTVSDLETSLGWYCDTVGFIVVQKWEEDGKIAGAVVEAGRIRLFLVQSDKEPSEPDTQTMQFYCSSAQDIDDLAAAIQSRGGVLDKAPADQPWGARCFDLLDPDGVRLTISSIEGEGAS